MRRLLAIALGLAACGLLASTAEQPALLFVYTTAQAEAGRTEYQSDCARCHTYKLTGRKGEAGELPLVESLDESAQKMIRNYGGKVPPLAGPEFMAKWGPKTTQDLSQRIREAAGPDEQRYLKITAYILQSNGAQPGPQALTAETSFPVRSVSDPR